jgi:hypothetical protein
LNEPFELPSLQEIEEMERQRLQAIEPLQMFDDFVVSNMCLAAQELHIQAD